VHLVVACMRRGEHGSDFCPYNALIIHEQHVCCLHSLNFPPSHHGHTLTVVSCGSYRAGPVHQILQRTTSRSITSGTKGTQRRSTTALSTAALSTNPQCTLVSFVALNCRVSFDHDVIVYALHALHWWVHRLTCIKLVLELCSCIASLSCICSCTTYVLHSADSCWYAPHTSTRVSL
jgi:hypothetical protein